MAGWLKGHSSPSVYLVSPKCASCDETCCACSPSPKSREADLDHSQPTEWINDLVTDYVHQKSCHSGGVLAAEKPLHAGDVAAIERTLHVSSCALVLSLLYAERLKNTQKTYASTDTESSGENSRDHPVAPAPAPAPAVDSDDVELAAETPELNSRFSAAELFLVCVLTANKFLYDEGEPESMRNTDLAPVARIKVHHLHKLERIFLHRIKWNLYVSKEEFAEFLCRLERALALRALRSHGGSLHYQDIDRVWDIITHQACEALWVIFTVYAGIGALYALALSVISFGPLLLSLSLVHCQPCSFLAAVNQPLTHSSPNILGNHSAQPFPDLYTNCHSTPHLTMNLSTAASESAQFKVNAFDGCHGQRWSSADHPDFQCYATDSAPSPRHTVGMLARAMSYFALNGRIAVPGQKVEPGACSSILLQVVALLLSIGGRLGQPAKFIIK